VSEPLTPIDESEIADIVSVAASQRSPLAVAGGGTRSGLGRPVQAAAALSTAEMRGVTLYEPTELVISARAGTPLAEIEALLAENGQRLTFEPPDHRSLYGSTGGVSALSCQPSSAPHQAGAAATASSALPSPAAARW
jgi:glycolate oxidase FAD binding subunit